MNLKSILFSVILGFSLGTQEAATSLRFKPQNSPRSMLSAAVSFWRKNNYGSRIADMPWGRCLAYVLKNTLFTYYANKYTYAVGNELFQYKEALNKNLAAKRGGVQDDYFAQLQEGQPEILLEALKEFNEPEYRRIAALHEKNASRQNVLLLANFIAENILLAHLPLTSIDENDRTWKETMLLSIPKLMLQGYLNKSVIAMLGAKTAGSKLGTAFLFAITLGARCLIPKYLERIAEATPETDEEMERLLFALTNEVIPDVFAYAAGARPPLAG